MIDQPVLTQRPFASPQSMGASKALRRSPQGFDPMFTGLRSIAVAKADLAPPRRFGSSHSDFFGGRADAALDVRRRAKALIGATRLGGRVPNVMLGDYGDSLCCDYLFLF